MALHLGHRRSQDPNLFSPQHFDPLSLQGSLEETVGQIARAMPRQDTLHLEVRGVKMPSIRQAAIGVSVDGEIDGVPVADRESLLAMKLSAIAGRGQRKDFIDVFGLQQAGVGGSDLLGFAKMRLPSLDQTRLLTSLGYFEDADGAPMPEMLVNWRWPEVRHHFERTVRDELHKHQAQLGTAGEEPEI